MLESNTLCKN